MLSGRKLDLPPEPDIEVPPPSVALIDSYLAGLGERAAVSIHEVRDVLLDVRNSIWRAH